MMPDVLTSAKINDAHARRHLTAGEQRRPS